MIFWLWILIGILVLILFFLAIKIYLLKKAAREIREKFADRIASDTNTLIDIGSRDQDMKYLAEEINIQLKQLRNDRLRYQQGDWELLFRYSVFTTVSNGTKSEPVVLNRILEDSVSGFYAALRSRGITPEIRMPDGRVHRMLNRNAVSRIFGNLIGNALKYSDGDLIIELDESGRLLFANHASGLDEIETGRLFDRFYTVETASSGSTGLGLSIARALTEQMGGKIGAVYEEGMLKVSVVFSEKVDGKA